MHYRIDLLSPTWKPTQCISSNNALSASIFGIASLATILLPSGDIIIHPVHALEGEGALDGSLHIADFLGSMCDNASATQDRLHGRIVE